MNDEFLLETADLSRRLRKYFYLPLMIVGGFVCLGYLLLWLEGYSLTFTFEKVMVVVTILSLGLWWWTRKPRRMLFLCQGLVLLVIGLAFGSWVLYVLLWGDEIQGFPLPRAVQIVGGMTWGVLVSLGMCMTGVKCLHIWRALKGVSDSQLDAAISQARERARPRNDDDSSPET